jgi:hypothetical protein
MAEVACVRIGAVLLFTGMWFIADQSSWSAPTLPPRCDQKCRNAQGPFIEGDSESGKCFVYTATTCTSCKGGGLNTAYWCSEWWESTGLYCNTKMYKDENGFPTVKYVGKDPILNRTDPEAAPCTKYCPARAPGFEARTKTPAAADENLREHVLHAECNNDPPVQDPVPKE